MVRLNYHAQRFRLVEGELYPPNVLTARFGGKAERDRRRLTSRRISRASGEIGVSQNRPLARTQGHRVWPARRGLLSAELTLMRGSD